MRRLLRETFCCLFGDVLGEGVDVELSYRENLRATSLCTEPFTTRSAPVL